VKAALLLTMVAGLTSSRAAEPPQFAADSLVALRDEPPVRLVVDAPLPDHLAQGRVVVRYRTENLRIVPVYGPHALAISPRVGHLHITVDQGPWRWVDASGEPLIINKLSAGPHKILIEVADPTHKVITSETVQFEVPQTSNP
jgi:hypothetical protein